MPLVQTIATTVINILFFILTIITCPYLDKIQFITAILTEICIFTVYGTTLLISLMDSKIEFSEKDLTLRNNLGNVIIYLIIGVKFISILMLFIMIIRSFIKYF